MGKQPFDPNAIQALNEMRMEMARELGVVDTFAQEAELDPVNNIFPVGPSESFINKELTDKEDDLTD